MFYETTNCTTKSAQKLMLMSLKCRIRNFSTFKYKAISMVCQPIEFDLFAKSSTLVSMHLNMELFRYRGVTALPDNFPIQQ